MRSYPHVFFLGMQMLEDLGLKALSLEKNNLDVPV
jgi:hypothetical protein